MSQIIVNDATTQKSKAMERATYAAKSLIIALALVKKRISVEEAALAATVEVNSQIERWGEVEDSELSCVSGPISKGIDLLLSSRC